MGARLRRSGKAAFVGLLVAVALVGSAWLAFATTAPKAPTYQASPIRIEGKGFCGDKRAHTRFQFDVARRANGSIRGGLHTQVGSDLPGTSFQGRQLTVLTVTGNTASFTIVGSLKGRHHDSRPYVADVIVTNAHPDTFATSVQSSTKVIYAIACEVRGGGIAFKKH